MAETESYSLREAAYLADLPVARIEKASERGEVQTAMRTVKGRRVKVVPKQELALYRYGLDHRQDLPKTGWSMVQAQFRRVPEARFSVTVSQSNALKLTVAVDLGEVLRLVDERERMLRGLQGIASGGDDDDPLLDGTDISLYRVAALVGDDGDISRAKAAFPSLDDARIGQAAEYARLYPKKGRPYPTRSLKETLGSIDLSDVPFEPEGEDEGPREVRI
jgi:hypothetical protein